MNNKTVLAFFLAAFAVLTCLPVSAQQKIAVVDLEKLVRYHPNTAGDKTLLEAKLKESSEEKDKLQEVMLATRKAFEEAARAASNPALSESARKTAEASAREKRQEALDAEKHAAERVRELQRELNEYEISMLKRTTEAIERAIAAYCKVNNIDLVLQLPSPKIGVVSSVLYAKQEFDITDDIMKIVGCVVPEDEEADDQKDAGAAGKEAKEEKKEAPAAPAK